MSGILAGYPPVDSSFLRSMGRGSLRARARARKNRATNFMKNWRWDAYDVSNKLMERTPNDIFLGASDVSDYLESDIMLARNDRGMETQHHEFTVLATKVEWMHVMQESKLRAIQLRASNGLLVEDDTLSYLGYNISSSSIIIKCYGDHDFVQFWYEKLTDEFEEVRNVIEWIYSGDGQSIEIPLRSDRTPVAEMYPFIKGETLEEYYDRFMHSSASILLLIGPPGTGKTTFIRGLLQHTESSAMVTYDTKILEKDYLFAQFIEGDRNVMVVEDADNFLGARTDGNDMMHKFLNVGDGLVTTKNKKLIFSTNLPSIKDIDSALIRPGRCFDILHFDTLTHEQAVSLADKLNVTLDSVRDKWSLADIFHKQVEAPRAPRRKLGFV